MALVAPAGYLPLRVQGVYDRLHRTGTHVDRLQRFLDMDAIVIAPKDIRPCHQSLRVRFSQPADMVARYTKRYMRRSVESLRRANNVRVTAAARHVCASMPRNGTTFSRLQTSSYAVSTSMRGAPRACASLNSAIRLLPKMPLRSRYSPSARAVQN